MTMKEVPLDSIHLTRKILIAMVAAIIVGSLLRFFPAGGWIDNYLVEGLFSVTCLCS
ncbi:MAG: hypothetical protein GY782_02575 [Gammaproteobacteria bacterium]|nr:hypothetical protein [Gammaproteobacteria bacterium]